MGTNYVSTAHVGQRQHEAYVTGDGAFYVLHEDIVPEPRRCAA
jgi:hypothetical protein